NSAGKSIRFILVACGTRVAGHLRLRHITLTPITTLVQESTMSQAKSPIPEGFHTVTPQLMLDDAAKAIEWYKKALGATEVSRAVGPDGKILHADMKIGDSHVIMNDAMGARGPRAFGGSPATFWIY